MIFCLRTCCRQLSQAHVDKRQLKHERMTVLFTGELFNLLRWKSNRQFAWLVTCPKSCSFSFQETLFESKIYFYIFWSLVFHAAFEICLISDVQLITKQVQAGTGWFEMQQYNGNSGLGIELCCRECLRQLGKDRVQLEDEINAFFGSTEGSYTWFKLHTASTFILNKIKNKKEGKPR